jgi:hypothetical protein
MFSRERERESDWDRSEVVQEVVSVSAILSRSLSVMIERQCKGAGDGAGEGESGLVNAYVSIIAYEEKKRRRGEIRQLKKRREEKRRKGN